MSSPKAVAATRRDWRYAFLRVPEWRERTAEILSSDLTTAMARIESCLTEIGRKGSAGAWLENEALLAVRLILEELRVRLEEGSAEPATREYTSKSERKNG